jgi:hypothetical protein
MYPEDSCGSTNNELWMQLASIEILWILCRQCCRHQYPMDLERESFSEVSLVKEFSSPRSFLLLLTATGLLWIAVAA